MNILYLKNIIHGYVCKILAVKLFHLSCIFNWQFSWNSLHSSTAQSRTVWLGEKYATWRRVCAFGKNINKTDYQLDYVFGWPDWSMVALEMWKQKTEQYLWLIQLIYKVLCKLRNNKCYSVMKTHSVRLTRIGSVRLHFINRNGSVLSPMEEILEQMLPCRRSLPR